MENLDARNRIEWEKRSKLFGTSARSVLFKGLANALNEHLHH
jgi:hypothetical protein